MKIHPDTLFSFPIEPFYYSLVPHHASRFLTYEFQTTGQEQTETISDLEKNKPQMVIFDMLQAEGLSGSVNRISDYVTTHYRTVQSVSVINYLKMMVPRDVPVLEQHLAFHIYQNNYRDKKTIDGYHIDNHDGTITDGIIMRGVSSRFNLAIDQSAVLIAGVTAEPGSTDVSERCGQITIQAASANISRRVCASDGQQSIDLAEFVGRAAMITLTRLSDLPIVWIDPTIKAAVNVGVKP